MRIEKMLQFIIARITHYERADARTTMSNWKTALKIEK